MNYLYDDTLDDIDILKNNNENNKILNELD